MNYSSLKSPYASGKTLAQAVSGQEWQIGLRVFSRYKDVTKDRNTRDHLVWDAHNWDHTHEASIPHRIPRAWKQQRRNKKKKQPREY